MLYEHTISDAGMVGGGNPPARGEITLSHHTTDQSLLGGFSLTCRVFALTLKKTANSVFQGGEDMPIPPTIPATETLVWLDSFFDGTRTGEEDFPF